MQRYNPKDIESKWQKKWEDDGIYQAHEDDSRPKKYILEYFPYPSGVAMHVGHVRNYTIGDAIARFNRMNGYNVLHPMGWDAFGLPAENFAIKNQVSPRVAIDTNTARFKEQLMQMGFSYDWSREIDSTDPKYYRWTQWFFLLLFKKGLAYQHESLQWWCPIDKTVLANEQVESGKCWRCGNPVEKKALKQWFFKITDYADRLLDDLDDLKWSDAIKSMQRNWIGRSRGAEITFAVAEHDASLQVFTTRPDTLYGVTFMVLAPEHPLVPTITTANQKGHVNSYVHATQAKSEVERQDTDREKTGVFTGAYALHPLSGETIPIWIADYVLSGYGTGAIMAVPAHDERDYAFAQKFDLPVITVVAPAFRDYEATAIDRPSVVVVARDPKTDTYCILNWHGKGSEAGLGWPGGGIDEGETLEAAAVREFKEETGYNDVVIDRVIPAATATYYDRAKYGRPGKMRSVRSIVLAHMSSLAHSGTVGTEEYEKDAYEVLWLPADKILKDTSSEWHAIAEFALQELIYHGEGVMINSGSYDNLSSADAREKIVADLAAKNVGTEKVNYRMRDWLISRQRYWGAPIPIIHCPKDGAVAVPEDQLPVVLPELTRFEPTGDGRSPLAGVPEFVQTTCPKCGGPAERETDTMDGFACSSWYFLRFADPHNDAVPFNKEKAAFWLPVDDYIGGAEHAVMHLLYARFWTKVMQDEGLINFSEPFQTLRNHGMILAPDGNKMSKSKGNTIEPEVLLEQGYGADSIRIMELFIGPWNQAANWSVEGMGGAYRFLQRIWTLVQEFQATPEHAGVMSPELRRVIHKTTKKVSQDLHELSFNTAIASLMECVNELFRTKAKDSYAASNWHESLETILQLLAPFAPHISEELWLTVGHDESIHISAWPKYDEQYLSSDVVTIVVQVNGKARAQLEVASDATEATIVDAAKATTKIIPYIQNAIIKKVIYVPGRIINFVIESTQSSTE
jgi:leucyl-tRNA synthetase